MAWRVDERIIYEGTQMTLKVAVQMDPMHAIKIAGDSTFYLMLAAQKRGHELFHYLAPDLNYRDGCLTARSEEHTSEIQSLMRISYAVFCLKKKRYPR